MNNHFKLLALAGFLSSCITINFQIEGITSDYQYLSYEEKTKVKKLSTFEEAKAGNVYEITGMELREELKKNDSSIVHFFVNKCKSSHCYPMSTYGNYIDESGQNVYLIMLTYADLDYSLNQEPDFPLYAVNAKYYEERKTRKYRELFVQDLLQEDYQDAIQYKTFFFNKDKLVKVQNDIFED